MSAPDEVLAQVTPEQFKAWGARTSESVAQELVGAPSNEAGDQMAAFVSRVPFGGEPLIVLGLVVGRRQMTLTLSAPEADQLCHTLADAVLWQNEELRQKAGQRVH